MRFAPTLRAGSAGFSLCMLSALAQPLPPPDDVDADGGASASTGGEARLSAELERLKRELAEQRALLRALREELAAQRTAAAAPAALPAPQPAQMGAQIGAQIGAQLPPQLPTQPPAQSAAHLPTHLPDIPADWARQPLAPGAPALERTALAALRGTGPAAQSQPQPELPPPRPVPSAPAPPAPAVGQAPARETRPPEVAPLFEAPGVLTPRGRMVLEPSFQFGYSSSNRVALVGYTIIPALLIGLVDVREVKRNTATAALTGRYGLTNRTEAELRVPYVYRSDSTVSRELFTGTAVEHVFDTSGKALGDVELMLRHQLNGGGVDRPYYVAGLRIKTRTGRDPFEVVTDCTRRCVGENATGTGLPLDLPTGSGFYGIQPSVTWLFPSDPAILFGSVSYLYNVKRSNVTRRVLNGETEPLGEVKPGAVLGFNFGVGLALNDKASLSIGYDHSSMGRTKQNGAPVPGTVRTQLGTLLVGMSYRLNDKRTVNVTVGAGLTRDTPDVSLSVRVPISF